MISVFLADDNLLVREGVKALIQMAGDLQIVGEASDLQTLVDGATATAPQVVVTDIRMPPDFSREGVEAAAEIRRRHPGTGVVILSRYDDPEYAVALLAEGASGLAYLLKDCVAEGDQLARAIREVATGGSMLDPKIVQAPAKPVTATWALDPGEERLLVSIAEGMPIKAIAVAARTTPAAVDASIERLFVKLAEGLHQGQATAVDRLRVLHRAITDREEQGERLARLLPGGVADKLIRTGRQPGETDTLEVTVLMSDIRGYSAIEAQDGINMRWEDEGLDGFGLGIGLSTGKVAAALLGSEERLEYSVVGDTVNLTQRLQQFAERGQTVLSESTAAAVGGPPDGADRIGPSPVKGRAEPVTAWLCR